YKEPFEPLGWVWKGINWKWIVGTILISILFILGTISVIGLAGNTLGISSFGTLDFSEDAIIQKLVEIVTAGNPDLPVDIEAELEKLPFAIGAIPLLAVTFLGGIFAAFTINLPFMFGEEFGWRGLLLKETQQLGFLKSNLLIGVIWGLWHSPIILMGHNYPEYPVIGVGMMCLFTTALAFPFAYIRLKTKSILGPCVMHGMINATAASLLYFTWGGHSLVTGMTGVAGLIAIALVAFAIFVLDRTFVKEYPTF
ncbi:MAG: CPBP family intramembrane metalloprotease, partial [Flavobacteriales bacterium]|nr:CPBP family intramembrane metalloprotease [Flavobacteriales bacterium]